jgi:predicted nucleic-acid-binding Zn-ribbon protein
MNNHTVKTCPKCGQQLRIPDNIGGMLMACPSCGQKLYSDFKLNHTGSGGQRNVLVRIFEMPETLLSRILRFFTFK